MFSISKILVLSLTVTATVIQIDAVYCPHYCKCFMTHSFRHVTCNKQNLISVELEIPVNVQWLELSKNQISELEGYIFMNLGMEKLEILDLSYNTIKSVSFQAFYGLYNIKFIDLTKNHLYRVDPRTFEFNPLIHLNLNSNPLKYITAHKPFLKSSSLQILEISDCRLSYFPPDTFSLLPSLQILNISNNDILVLNEDQLINFNNVIELDITHTAIKCDGSIKTLLNWANNRSAKIIGSPCSSKSNEFTLENKEEPKKFEKIINDPDNDPSESYTYDNCICPDESKNNKDDLERKNTEKISQENLNLSKHQRVMPWVSFLNGMIIGAAISASFILFWIYGCRYRTRRNTRRVVCRENMVANEYVNINSEIPPPSYYDLFHS